MGWDPPGALPLPGLFFSHQGSVLAQSESQAGGRDRVLAVPLTQTTFLRPKTPEMGHPSPCLVQLALMQQHLQHLFLCRTGQRQGCEVVPRMGIWEHHLERSRPEGVLGCPGLFPLPQRPRGASWLCQLRSWWQLIVSPPLGCTWDLTYRVGKAKKPQTPQFPLQTNQKQSRARSQTSGGGRRDGWARQGPVTQIPLPCLLGTGPGCAPHPALPGGPPSSPRLPLWLPRDSQGEERNKRGEGRNQGGK